MIEQNNFFLERKQNNEFIFKFKVNQMKYFFDDF